MRDRLAWPIPLSERISIVYIERQSLELVGHNLVACAGDRRAIIPAGRATALFIGPGSSVSHAAVALCALEGVALVWVGEEGVRFYSAGNPLSSPEHLLLQDRHHLDGHLRLNVARRIYRLMFGEDAPVNRSIEQLRGMEGVRVKAIFKNLAQTARGVEGPADCRQAGSD